MLKQTPLHADHLNANGKMVDFAGWSMPIHYGSQVEEHRIVRDAAGLFDVSHMGVCDVTGADACAFLRFVCANDVARLKSPGRAIYTCMLNEQGGIIDDLIVYWLDDAHYRIVLNASRRDVDFAWLLQHAKAFDVTVRMNALCIIAIQGPTALQTLAAVLDRPWQVTLSTMKPFQVAVRDNVQIATTGYTGEQGAELILPAQQAKTLWAQLVEAGAKPCGLGARDTLRLEAGLNLYGTDMDESTTPDESNLAWTVSLHDVERAFIGKSAIVAQRETGVTRQLVGLVMESRGVLRNHQTVFADGEPVGEITSGSFAPTLNCAVAFARLPSTIQDGLTIDRRGQSVPVQRTTLPFVRAGKAQYSIVQ